MAAAKESFVPSQILGPCGISVKRLTKGQRQKVDVSEKRKLSAEGGEGGGVESPCPGFAFYLGKK